MALKIDADLIAVPSVTGLPATLKLRQTLKSNIPNGEAAQIVYTVQGDGKVVFEGGGTTFEVAGILVPNSPLTREDTVGLVWVGETAASPAEVVIDQEITGVENTRHDSVVIAVQ